MILRSDELCRRKLKYFDYYNQSERIKTYVVVLI